MQGIPWALTGGKVSEPGKAFFERTLSRTLAATEALKKEGYDFMITIFSTGDADRFRGKDQCSCTLCGSLGKIALPTLALTADASYRTGAGRDFMQGKISMIAA